MTTYNTGNPIGSTAVKDLYDNAENLDQAVNGTEKTWTDRRGVVRKSFKGIEQDMATLLENSWNVSANTLTQLNAITHPRAGSGGLVLNDPIEGNNGWYRKTGEAGAAGWERIEDQPALESTVKPIGEAAHAAALNSPNVFNTVLDNLNNGEGNDGGELLYRNGVLVGFRIPSGVTGAITYISATVAFTPEQIAELTGSTLRWTVSARVTPGFETEKGLRSNRAVRASTSTGTYNRGTFISEDYSDGKLKRVVEYVVQGDETRFGPLLSTDPGASVSANDHELIVEDVRYTVASEANTGDASTFADRALDRRLEDTSNEWATSQEIEVNPVTQGYASLVNGAVSYPAGATDPSVSGITIPAGSTGAQAYSFQLYDMPADLIAKLAGSRVRFTVEFGASENFLIEKGMARNGHLRVARNGQPSANVPTDLIALYQDGDTITRVLEYVVDPDDEKWGVYSRVPSSSTAVGVEHFVFLKSIKWQVVEAADGLGDSKSNLRFSVKLGEDLRSSPEIVRLDEALNDKAITSGNVFPSINVTGSQDSNGAEYILESGRIVGMRYPAGVSGAGGFLRMMHQFPRETAEALVGKVIRFTLTADVSPTLEADKPFRSNRAVYSQEFGNVGTLISETFEGNKYTRVVEWEVQEGAYLFGPMTSYVQHSISSNDNWIIVTGVYWEVVGSDFANGTSNDFMLDSRLARALESVRAAETAPPLTITVRADETESVFDQSLTPEVQSFTIESPHGKVHTPKGAVSFDAPATEAVVDHPFTMIAAPGGGAIPGARLPHQYVTDYTVTRVSDSAVLVEGVDYAIKPDTPYIYGLQDIPDFACTISYTGHLHRYDLLTADPQSGALAVTKGTERAIDPEEYKPTIPSGRILLNTVYVNRHGTDLLQSWRYRKLRDRLAGQQWDDWLAYCRACLPKTLAKLRRGEPIKLIGYGSSSVDMGGGGSSQLVPNGPRDRASFFDRIPADTRSLYPRYDGTDSDFLGSPYSDHVKFGFIWQLIFAMRERWGADVEYRNWGVGATTSQNVINGNGRMGGLYPDRLNAMLADEGDLMVLAFANGLGGSWQYSTNREIVEAFKAAGGEVIVLTTPRLNFYGGGSVNDTSWLHTHDQLVRAALDTDSAYVSTYMLEGPGREGNSGLSPKNMTNSNLYNHGGPAQLIGIGKHMASIIP